MPRNTIRGAPCNNKFPLVSLVSRTSVLAGAVNELAVCLEFMYPEHSPCSFAGFKLVVNQPRQRCAVPVGCLFQVVGMEVALAEHLVDHEAGQPTLNLGNDESRAGSYRRAAAIKEPAEIGHRRQIAAHAGQAQKPFLGARDGRDARKGNDFFNLVDSTGQIVVAQSENNAVPVADLLRSEEHTSELQSRGHLVCRLLLEKKKTP